MNIDFLEEGISDLVADFEKLSAVKDNGEIDFDLAVTVFKKEIKVSLLQTISGIYAVLRNTHVVSAYSMFCSDLKEATTVGEFYENLMKLDVGVKLMVKEGAERAKMLSSLMAMNLSDDYIKSWYQHCKDFSSFYNDILSFAGTAAVLIDRLDAKRYNRAFYKNVAKSIETMTSLMRKAESKSKCLIDRTGKTFDFDNFQLLYNYYMSSASCMNLLIENLMLKMDFEKEVDGIFDAPEQIDKSKIFISSSVDEKQQARLQAIKEANDLYEMFQMDFMRDLNREVSMMNRDMYDALIEKIEKFLKKFPMPLDNSVSLGMAQEAKFQINKFIETVCEISRNTYNPVIMQRG